MLSAQLLQFYVHVHDSKLELSKLNKLSPHLLLEVRHWKVLMGNLLVYCWILACF